MYDPELLPCAKYDSGELVVLCDAFMRYRDNAALGYSPRSVDVDSLRKECDQFTEHRLADFVAAGLCAYSNRIKEESVVAVGLPERSRYTYGQCPVLEAHVQASLS